jgi:hypothetical protein
VRYIKYFITGVSSMKQLFLILACLALASCVPVEAASTDAPADLPAASQVEVETAVEKSVCSDGWRAG